MSKIAICITTKDRPEVFNRTYSNIIDNAPCDSVVFVVDDGSKEPAKVADIRNEKSLGIAAAKNQCLALAYKSGAEHIFLLDDDVRLKTKDWYIPYAESNEPHLSYNFVSFKSYTYKKSRQLNDTQEIYRDNSIVAYNHSRGCFLYFKRCVLKEVGGFDESFGIAMGEHQAYSNRIYNAGLTSFRYMDVPHSDQLIHSMDEWQEVQSSILRSDRIAGLKNNKSLEDESLTSKEYCGFRNNIPENNIILTSYLTNHIDEQRHRKWQPDLNDIQTLYTSVYKHGYKLITLNDCFPEDSTMVRVESTMNPYWQRWLNQYRYLRDHPEIDNVFCLDATDTEILKDPFKNNQCGKLFVGHEASLLSNKWLISHSSGRVLDLLVSKQDKQLLNCGVVGGSRELVMQFCRDMIDMYFATNQKDLVDMPIFNYLCYTKYLDDIEWGDHIVTNFKQFEYNNTKAMIRHK